jgi:hypothetical protein
MLIFLSHIFLTLTADGSSKKKRSMLFKRELVVRTMDLNMTWLNLNTI